MKMVLRGAFSQIGIGLALWHSGGDWSRQVDEQSTLRFKPWDPSMVTLAALLFGLAALVASPVRRAAGVEPMVALRNG